MTSNPSMRAYVFVWVGQTLSRFGTYMTAFALFSIWVWEQTGQATALALIGVATTFASAIAAFIGGVIVDRYPRKHVMIAADSAAAVSTLFYLLLYVNDELRLWHILVGSVVTGFFAQIHGLAWTAATSLMIPKEHYARSGSMRYLTYYGAIILSPALAGTLYYTIGLSGIMLIDLMTVTFAVGAVALVNIPNPERKPAPPESKWRQLTFGFRYVWQTPTLFTLLVSMTVFSFAYNMGAVLQVPMILARTGNDVQALAAVSSVAGIGGLVGAVVMSFWGGPKRLVNGWLGGLFSLGVIRMFFSLGRSVLVWIPGQISASITFPVLWGASQGILMAKVPPETQGRFFGVQQIVMLMASALAQIVAGPLGDYVFEPAMQPGGFLAGSLDFMFGTGPGAGFALLSFISAAGIVLVALCSQQSKRIQNLDVLLPDYDEKPEPAKVTV